MQEFALRYPFTNEAKAALEKDGTEALGQLLPGACDSVRMALTKFYFPKDAAHGHGIAHFAACMMIASGLPPAQKKKFAIAVAKSYYDSLKEDAENNEIFFFAVARNFGMELLRHMDLVRVPLAKYLRFAPHDPHYKLANREVAGGYVTVRKRELARLLEEALNNYVYLRLSRSEPPPQAKALSDRLARELKLDEQQFAKVNIEEQNYPPCIKALIASLRAGENLPHMARWTLANYLLHANVPVDRIVDLFRTAPDFSERVTRYQVEFVANRKYSMPSCSTVKANGFCVAECGCGTPLRYRPGMEKRNEMQQPKK